MSDTHLTGRCLCGRVEVSVVRAAAIPAVCHCTHCQKQTASAFSPVLIVPIGDITITGELKSYEDTNDAGDRVTRMFCPNCGSPVRTVSAKGRAAGVHYIKAGLLDGGAPRPNVEVFRRSRCDWLPDLRSERQFDAVPAG